MKIVDNTDTARGAGDGGAAWEGNRRAAPPPAEVLAKALSSVFRAHTLYPETHPAIREAVTKFLACLERSLSETDRIVVCFLGKDLILLAGQLERIDGSIPGLNQVFQERGIEKITLRKGVGAEETQRFFAALAAVPQAEEGAKPEFPARSDEWPHITVGRLHGGSVAVDLKSGKPLHALDEAGFVKEFLESCQELVAQIRYNSLIEFSLARDVIQGILNGIILEDQVIPVLAGIKENDEYTFTHILNVSTLALAMGRTLGLTEQQLRDLGLAALLHDTGKLLVPTEILQKKEHLTDAEFHVMRMHPIHGAAMLIRVREMPDLVPIVAFEHHLFWNGRGGYPPVAEGYLPHLCSRITTIADVFDALRTNRVYREETPKEETLLKMSTMEVDPFLFNLFARLANLYSVGAYVRLDSGEIGVIHAINPQNAFRPEVRILRDAEGRPRERERIVNLASFDRNRKAFVHSITDLVPREEMESATSR